MYIWKTILSELNRRKRGLYETRAFILFFIELFCVQASLFLGALLQEYALFCQIMLLFFCPSLTAGSTFLPDDRLKNAPRKRQNFWLLQKQEQLQKEQEQLLCFQKAGDSRIPAVYHPKLETLQNYLKTNEYDKIQDYLPSITDDFRRETFPSHLSEQP